MSKARAALDAMVDKVFAHGNTARRRSRSRQTAKRPSAGRKPNSR